MKVSLFCENVQIGNIKKSFVRNTYPTWLCINGHNIQQFTHIYRESIKITTIDSDILGFFSICGIRTCCKIRKWGQCEV